MTEDGPVLDDPRGRSLRGQALEGADFSGKDVRGTDFTGADLRSSTFRNATLGVPPRVGAVILGSAMLVALSAGLAIGWAVHQMTDELSARKWDEVAQGSSIGLILIVLVALILWRGYDFAIRFVAFFYVLVLAANLVANLLWDKIEWVTALRATALIIFLVLAVTVGTLGRVTGGVFGTWSVALVAVLGGLASGRAEGGIVGVVVAVCLAIIAKRAVKGDPRDRTLRHLAHRLVRRWGTKFIDADLTGTDFTGTDGSRCDVRGATVADVTWDPDHPMPLDLPDEAIPT